MGATGAGKTTLMDVLAGRKTHGVTRGSILVNGHEKQQDTWVRTRHRCYTSILTDMFRACMRSVHNWLVRPEVCRLTDK